MHRSRKLRGTVMRGVMPNIEINSPKDLVQQLLRIFPGFAQEWDEGEGYGYEKGDYKLHTVFLTFGEVSSDLLKKSTPGQIREFCALINGLVAKGGDFENAVSTCFLEHASALGARQHIEPH